MLENSHIWLLDGLAQPLVAAAPRNEMATSEKPTVLTAMLKYVSEVGFGAPLEVSQPIPAQ